MITKECFYYEKTDTPKEYSAGVAWVDPGDGSKPYPDLVEYRDGEWMATDLDGDLVPVEDCGKVVCIQKLEFPDSLSEVKISNNDEIAKVLWELIVLLHRVLPYEKWNELSNRASLLMENQGCFNHENVPVMRTLEETVFKNEMGMAQSYLSLQPDRSEYWKGYIRGLRKAYHGENFGTAIEHAAYCEAIYSDYPARKMLGQGYRDGLRGEAVLK